MHSSSIARISAVFLIVLLIFITLALKTSTNEYVRDLFVKNSTIETQGNSSPEIIVKRPISEYFSKIKEPIKLLIVIPISLGEAEIASVKNIRNSYGKRCQKDCKVLFFTGIHSLSEDKKKLMDAENSIHDDIIPLDMLDTYKNLSFKMALVHHWLYLNIPDSVEYILKTDLDTWVSIEGIFGLMKEHGKNKTAIGHIAKDWGRHKTGAYANPAYLGDTYPPFFLGAGYLFTSDISKWLGFTYEKGWLRILNCEDVLFGVWLNGLNIKWVHRGDVINPFHKTQMLDTRPPNCQQSYILVHGFTDRMILQMENDYTTCGNLCGC